MTTRIRKYLDGIRGLQGDPDYLARGVAIGVFVGVAPLMPLKTVIIVTLTLALSGSTVAGILSCTIICNPFTYLPLYYFAWLVGDYLLPGKASWPQLKAGMTAIGEAGLSEAVTIAAQVGLDTCIVALAGGVILALPIAVLSYPFAHRLFVSLARHRKKEPANNE